jgi:hypothetical protein
VVDGQRRLRTGTQPPNAGELAARDALRLVVDRADDRSAVLRERDRQHPGAAVVVEQPQVADARRVEQVACPRGEVGEP